jgi:hypothetical protein
MTDEIGVDTAVMDTALEDMEVIDHSALPTPMDMAIGMEPGITAPQASMFKLEFNLRSITL